MSVANNIKLWLNIGRGYTIPQSALPYIFAVILAAKQYKIDYFLSFLGLIGIVSVHLSFNMLDDYFDWKKGAVAKYKELAQKGIVAITNKCFYFEQNLTTPKTVFIVSLVMDAIAFLIGIFIALKVGTSVIIIALITAVLGFFYSSDPVKLSYIGLGEPVIGIIFGPLLMFGAYITAGASPDKVVLFASIIIGLLVANIAYTHAIMDFDSDIKAGKKSFPILFKTKDNAIKVQCFIYIFAYVIFAVSLLLKVYPLKTVLVFITLPKALALIKLMKTEAREKKLWMGPVENWEQLKKEGLDWFMLRLCIARNLVTDFIVIFSIAYYL